MKLENLLVVITIVVRAIGLAVALINPDEKQRKFVSGFCCGMLATCVLFALMSVGVTSAWHVPDALYISLGMPIA